MSRNYRCYLVPLVVVCASSCENIPTQTQPEQTSRETTTQVVDLELQRKINRLLDEAYLAYEKDHLTTPLDSNAYFRYLQVLSLDSTNHLAEQGIAEIVERYLEWAIIAAQNQNFRKAIDYLNKGRSVDETHPNIDAVEKMIAIRRSLDHKVYDLAVIDLNLRESDFIAQLHDIGKQVEIKRATVVINARSDSEGRWIYQQLNDATNSRVRATFEPAQTPSIRLVFQAPNP